MRSLDEPFIKIHPLEIFTGATREAGHAGVHLPSQHLGGRGRRVRSSQTELGCVLLVGKNVASSLAGFMTA